ncbi:hypothetical protein ACLBW2_06795 [Enterobacteriaceae bacterium C23F]
MTYRIETRNHYLRFALVEIMPRVKKEPAVCIVDLASFHSFTSLVSYFKKHAHSTEYILIGNHGVYSRLLAPLISLRSEMPIEYYVKVIKHYPRVTYEMVMRFLNYYSKMEGFSHKEVSTVYSLLLNDSLTSAARHIGANPKQFYRRVDQLVKKMNMKSHLQVHHMLRREFCPDYVRGKIEGQIRLSF